MLRVDWGDPDELFLDFSPVRNLATGNGWHIRRWERDQWVPGLLSEIPSLENGLVRLNGDGSMTIRYEIHPDAVWEDGTPITGADFAFTHEFVTANLEDLVEIAIGFNTDPPWSWEVPNIDPGLFVVEDKAFEYTLPVTRRWPALFNNIVPKHQVVTTELAPWLDGPAPWYTAGPWIHQDPEIVEVGPSGWPEATAVRNDRYWGTDPDTGQATPFWDERRWIIVPDGDQAWEYFLTTPEVDFISHDLSSDTIDDVIANDLVVVVEGGNFEHIGFNFGPSRFDANPDSLVEHLAFRQAIAHALDRDRIAAEVFGGKIDAVNSYVGLFSPSHSTDAWSRYDYNPEKARTLLGELCAELGRDCAAEPPTLAFSTSQDLSWRPQTAELVEEMLEEVGIEVTLDIDHEGIGEVIEEGYETIMFAWTQGAAGIEPLIAIHEAFLPGGPFNIYSWGAPDSAAHNATTARYEEIVVSLVTSFDDEIASIGEAEQILADELVFIPLFPPGFTDIWKPDRFAGPEAEVIATNYPGAWEIFYRTDLGDAARHEP